MDYREESKGSFPVFLVLAAVVGGLWLYQGPLKSSRPVDGDRQKLHSIGDKRVQSRLWEDPFDVVQAHRRKEFQVSRNRSLPLDPHHEVDDFIQELTGSLSRPSKITFMPILVNGSPYSEGIESRLRQRYAIVSALGEAGYAPEDGEYIRYFEWDKDSCTEILCKTGFVPLEWFKKQEENGESHILVLWLKDQDFRLAPLQNLEALIEFSKKFKNGDFLKEHHKITIMGPRSSGTLRRLLSHLLKNEKDIEEQTRLTNVKIYSSWATAADALLINDSEQFRSNWPDWSDKGVIKIPRNKEPNKEGFQLIRTIGTDADLSEHLIAELERRGIEIQGDESQDNKSEIALISEWDTAYGRWLPLTFTAVAMNGGIRKNERVLAKSIHRLQNNPKEWPNHIRRFSYLRGLDGELPQKDSGDSEGKTSQKEIESNLDGRNNKARIENLARAEGRSQFDYLVRLANRMKREEPAEGYKAIGLLGGDVYDKLLILQALRQHFRRAIFFTTDLDSRLLQKSELGWTRNLIVASHFGLSLRRSIQGTIPPFRDSYQTALYLSVLMAVEHIHMSQQDPSRLSMRAKENEAFDSKIRKIRPRLYEIGLNGGIDISVDIPRPDFSLPKDFESLKAILKGWFFFDSDQVSLQSFHEPRPKPQTFIDAGVLILKVVGGGIILVILLVPVSNCVSKKRDQVVNFCKRHPSQMLYYSLFVIVLLTFVIIPWFLSDRHEAEPFFLFEGISVWPTEIIRLLALVLAIGLLYKSFSDLETNADELMRDFKLPSTNVTPKLTRQAETSRLMSLSWFKCLLSIRKEMGVTFKDKKSDTLDIGKLWTEYKNRGYWKVRCTRFIPNAFLFFFVGIVLVKGIFGLSRPNSPYRGFVSGWTDMVVIVFSVLSMLALIFFVLDATRLCVSFVRRLASRPTNWSTGLLSTHSQARNMDPAYLDYWLDIRFIAHRTEAVGKLIYYPFLILFLMVISRNRYFDNWDIPLGLVILLTLSLMYAISSACLLRSAAEHARQMAVQNLKEKFVALKGNTNGEKVTGQSAEQLELTIKEIESISEGAFRPFTQHPVFRAIALPTGGYGVLMLIEYFLINQ